ncbi:hypothetical protein [Tunturiibacter gelidiferens]|uniref:Uncharacterized protein n=1 Tax=Tunturiibacter gelidiferens TaxID=3069689 RepID=A0AAU7Z1J3_9BACT
MAEQSSPDEQKRDNSTVLWETIQTFSDEAQTAAKKKATELQFSFNRGTIPFEETLINLSRNRDLLIAAIEDSALPQLPLKIQNQLISDAKKISSQLNQLTNGIDSIVTLESAVDDLTATIWHSNLQNMSGEILGFHKKQNQLKTLETTLRDLTQRATNLQAKEESANRVIEQIDDGFKKTNSFIEEINKSATEISQRTAAVKDAEQRVNASLALVQEEEKSIAQSVASSRTSSAELDSQKIKAESILVDLEKSKADSGILVKSLSEFRQLTETQIGDLQTLQQAEYKALDQKSQTEIARLQAAATDATTNLTTIVGSTLKASVEQFGIESTALILKLDTAEAARELKATTSLKKTSEDFIAEATEIKDEFRKSFEAATAKSNLLLGENELKTKERFDELIKLEDVIREKIRLATNFQLFHAFQTRQMAIAEGKNLWRNALFGFVIFSFVLAVAFIIYLFVAHPTYDAAFYLKLSISFPLVYAIHFCSTEYSKERKLEEEYAFKGNIRSHWSLTENLLRR